MATAGVRGGSSNRRRMSGWMKALLALGGVAVALGLLVVILDFVGRSALQTQLDAIRARGEPVTLADLEARRKPIPDEQNGAKILEPILDLLKPLTGDAVKGLPLLDRRQPIPVIGPFDTATIDRARSFLAERADLVAALDRMIDYPTGRFPAVVSSDPLDVFEPRPGRGAVRAAVKLKALDAVIKAIDGGTDQAALDTLVMFNIAATMEDDGTVLGMLILTSCDVLAVESLERTLSTGVCRDEVLARFAVVMARHERSEALLWAVWGERAIGIALFDGLRSGKVSSPAVMAVFARGTSVPLLGWNRLDEAKLLSLLNLLAEAAKDPEENLAVADEIDQEIASLSRFYVMTRMTVPALTRPLVLWVRRLTALRCTRTASAVERYRLAHAEWPPSLDALVPDYLDAVPADPFDRQALRYKVTDEGVTVYSIDEDRNDDGGDVERPRRGRAPDVGFRLLNPDLRVVRIVEQAADPPPDADTSGD